MSFKLANGQPEDLRINLEGLTFNQFFRDVMVDGIARVIGSNSAQAIVFHAKLSDTVGDVKLVHDSMENMLGKLGASMVERAIIREMFGKLGQKSPDMLTFSIVDFVASVDKGKKIFISMKEH